MAKPAGLHDLLISEMRLREENQRLRTENERLQELAHNVVDSYCELGASVGYSADLVQAWRREIRGASA